MCRAAGQRWELGEVDNCGGNRSGRQGEWVWLQPEKVFEKGWWGRGRRRKAGRYVYSEQIGAEQRGWQGEGKQGGWKGVVTSVWAKPQLTSVFVPLHPVWWEHSPPQGYAGGDAQRPICLGWGWLELRLCWLLVLRCPQPAELWGQQPAIHAAELLLCVVLF